MRILIVDDEIVSRESMRHILTEFGECVLTENAEKTISAFKKAWHDWRPFSLIALDIELPDMDGIEVLKNIRHLEKEKNIPEEAIVKIIMVTSHSDKDRVVECFKAGCNEFVIKPADKKNLKLKLSKIGI